MFRCDSMPANCVRRGDTIILDDETKATVDYVEDNGPAARNGTGTVSIRFIDSDGIGGIEIYSYNAPVPVPGRDSTV